MTMFLVRIPECQQAVEVVAEFKLEGPGGAPCWFVTAAGADAEGRGLTFDDAVKDFAEWWRQRWVDDHTQMPEDIPRGTP
jgi:hypothetical protein